MMKDFKKNNFGQKISNLKLKLEFSHSIVLILQIIKVFDYYSLYCFEAKARAGQSSLWGQNLPGDAIKIFMIL